MEDYYKILGVSKDASQDDIKAAYRKLVRKFHPDRGGSEEKMKKINVAYQTLGDKEKRSQYDQFGRTFEGGQGFPGFDFGSFWQGAEEQGAGFGFENLGDIFDQFFGSRQRERREDLRRGNDIQLDIEVDLEDTLSSQKQEFSIYKYERCSRCQGSGAEPGTKVKECPTCRGEGQVQEIRRTIFGTITHYAVCPKCQGKGNTPEKFCNVCRGEGRIKNEQKINITIPAGVDSGQMMRFRGKGDAGKRGGAPGDLYVRVFVKRHPVFERKGDDLYTNLKVNFSQVVLGDQIEVPTLDKGKITYLTVPAGTEQGKTFRISQKGIPRFSGYGRGNLYVKLQVSTPKRLTKKQKELLNKLREEGL